MTIKEITQLRNEGKLEEAYTECKRLLLQDVTNKDLRITMAWCLKSVVDDAAKKQDADRVIGGLEQLSELHLGEIGERVMANRFIWNIKVLFDALKCHPDRLSLVADRVFDILSRLDFLCPDKYYSMMADLFLQVNKLKAPWGRFMEFVDWLGWDNLRPEDYSKVVSQNGKNYLSLAERLYYAYAKALLTKAEQNNVDVLKIEQFADRLISEGKSHPEYQFVDYYKARLLLALGRPDEALLAIRPFVKNKPNDFWVWDLLADITDDEETKLSCYIRALSDRVDPKFLVRLRFKTANLMHTLGFDGNARREIREMHKVYLENGWNMPREAIEMARQEWYQSAVAPESNRDFYKKHLVKSDAFLYTGTPEIPILIAYVNKDKQVCNFLTDKRERGFFSYRHLRCEIQENAVYMVRLDRAILDGKMSKLLTCRSVDDVEPFMGIFFSSVEGQLQVRDSNMFGFVNDVYIDKQFLSAGLQNGDVVCGTAVLAFNSKKQTWSWRAILLKKKD